MVDEIAHQKQVLRTQVRKQRAELSSEQIDEFSQGITEQLKMLVTARGSRSVSCYHPVVGEPNTLYFVEWAHAEGIDVLLPISREDGLLDWVLFTKEEAQPGLYGIPEPAGEPLSPIAVSEVDLMIVPASAVDQQGNRLGWGRGYFDKSLGSMDQCPPVFAVVYDNELVDVIPTDLHDIPVTGAVTQSQILHFWPDADQTEKW